MQYRTHSPLGRHGMSAQTLQDNFVHCPSMIVSFLFLWSVSISIKSSFTLSRDWTGPTHALDLAETMSESWLVVVKAICLRWEAKGAKPWAYLHLVR